MMKEHGSMFTTIQSRVFVVLSLGLVFIGSSLKGQSVAPTDKPSPGDKIELSYHVKAIKRDSAGQYMMTGTVSGERQGRATLMFLGRYDDALVRTPDGWQFARREITFF